jgi:hypothetical protein
VPAIRPIIAATFLAERFDALLHVQAREARTIEGELAIETQTANDVGLSHGQPEGAVHPDCASERWFGRLHRKPQYIFDTSVVDCDVERDVTSFDVFGPNHGPLRVNVRLEQSRVDLFQPRVPVGAVHDRFEAGLERNGASCDID